MKMVVAYIERDSFDPIREELLGLGFLSISAWEASGTLPEATVTGSYRGTKVETHVRPKIRFECVVGEDEVQTVRDTVLKNASDRVFVFVLGVESAYPTETVKDGGAVAAA